MEACCGTVFIRRHLCFEFSHLGAPTQTCAVKVMEADRRMALNGSPVIAVSVLFVCCKLCQAVTLALLVIVFGDVPEFVSKAVTTKETLEFVCHTSI